MNSARGLRYRVRGFTLVELLLAMAIGLSVLAGVSRAVLVMLDAARVSADQAELAERGRFAVDLLAGDIGRSISVPSQVAPGVVGTPCDDPAIVSGLGLRVAEPGEWGCLPDSDLVTGSKLLILETAEACEPGCPSARWPGWLLLSPGCHPLFAMTVPELRLADASNRPTDCSLGTALSYWSRKVYFLRNYAWRRGDGIGALMVKQFKPKTLRFGAAEMLVPGVIAWALEPITGWGHEAVLVSLTLTGWEVDRQVIRPSGLDQLPLTFTAVSRNLQSNPVDAAPSVMTDGEPL